MLTLTFNTRTKTATIKNQDNKILGDFTNVPTVKIREGYYEIMQKELTDQGDETSIPVCRLPIQNTLMFIERN
jgi:hypothetical protein